MIVSTDPSIRFRGLTRDQYELLVDAGKFRDAPVELLGGVLVEMSPQGVPHAWVIRRLARLLHRELDDRYEVSEERPFALDELSEPGPDLAIIEPSDLDGHPDVAHLIIEVAHTSQRIDLGEKARRYAAAGVPIYWVWDLPKQQVVEHLDPTPDGYATKRTHGPDATLHALGVDVPLADLLPPVDEAPERDG